MSAGTVAGVTGGSLRRVVPRVEPWCVPDFRRVLQLSLAALWLFDGVLQLQPFMFTPAFGSRMIAPFASGNPAAVADAITWSAREMSRHSMLAGVAFAGIQLLIAVGIAWRPTVRAALALSIAWSFGVWWIGEGFGELLHGSANVLTGAPGAVVVYALLAVLLWPLPGGQPKAEADMVAARPLGVVPAKLIWLTFWLGLGALCLSPANRRPQSVRQVVTAMAVGQPSWLTAVDRTVARAVAGRGDEVAIILAVVFTMIGLGVFMPSALRRAALVLAVVAAGFIWIVGEAFGGVFSGPATDPSSGPVLVLLVAAYWPLRPRRPASRQPAAMPASRPA
ncbi:MAG: hypothetical protein ABSE47_00335 [Acidimicrobiales bacterium]